MGCFPRRICEKIHEVKSIKEAPLSHRNREKKINHENHIQEGMKFIRILRN